MRLISVLVASVWTGHAIVGLACAMACANIGGWSVSPPVESVRLAVHDHHVAPPPALVSPVRTDGESLREPSHHSCSESREQPARIAVPAGPRADKMPWPLAALAVRILQLGEPLVFSDRSHVRGRAPSPPGALRLASVLRI